MVADGGTAAAEPARLRDNEREILRRMRHLDSSGCGVFASVETIGKAVFPDQVSKSKSQTRLLLRRLETKGFIRAVGLSRHRGTVLYLLTERLDKYDRGRLPIDDKLTASSSWRREFGNFDRVDQALLTPKLYRSIFVGSRIQATYAEAVWKAAVDSLIATYGPQLDGVKSKNAIIVAACKRLTEAKRQTQTAKDASAAAELKAARRAEVSLSTAQAGADPVEAEIAAAMAQGMTLATAAARVALGERFVSAPSEVSAPAVAAAAVQPALEVLTVSDCLDRFLALRTATSAAATAEFYSCKIDRLREVLGERVAASLTMACIVSYVENRKPTVKLATVRKELGVLRSALRLARKAGAKIPDPSDYWPPIRFRTNRVKRYLKRDDLTRLIGQLTETQVDFVMWGLYTGARLGELRGLRWEDLDLREKTLHIRGTKTDSSDRVIPLHAKLCELATRHKGKTGPILRRWINIQRDLKLACDRAKLPPLSPNDLRRTFATWMKQAGADSAVVARLLGHVNSIMVDRVYGQLGSPQIVQALNLI